MTYGKLIRSPRIVFAVLAGGMGNFVYAQLEPMLALRLEEFQTGTF